MFDNNYYGLGRTMCDVLEEMRTLIKVTPNDRSDRLKQDLSYLIEEVQIMGNRMEDGLELKYGYSEMLEKHKVLNKKVRGLKDTVGKLENNIKHHESSCENAPNT